MLIQQIAEDIVIVRAVMAEAVVSFGWCFSANFTDWDRQSEHDDCGMTLQGIIGCGLRF